METLGGICRTKKKDRGLAHRIYEGLCREITSGKLRPGELLSRRRIAQHYGVSYTPVIEAMIRLENAGLIEAENAQMARVRLVSPESLQESAILREALETQAIRLACTEASAEEIAELTRLAQEVDERRRARDVSAKEQDPAGALLHWRFHLRIAQVSRCPALVREMERIELLRKLQATWVFIPAMNFPVQLHIWLAEAIARRDPLAADEAMRAHVRGGLKKELLESSNLGPAKNDDCSRSTWHVPLE